MYGSNPCPTLSRRCQAADLGRWGPRLPLPPRRRLDHAVDRQFENLHFAQLRKRMNNEEPNND